jgi:glycosyltransferase involved in cell wall biosynthesis
MPRRNPLAADKAFLSTFNHEFMKMPEESINNLASVIIPTYNRAAFITKSLDSVWDQTYRPIEVLVVDDGSTDSTKQVVEEWAKNHENGSFCIKYIYQDNKGAPVARNNGIENAAGRYLQFLDSDDVLIRDKLELQIAKLTEEHTPICICGYVHIDQEGKHIITMNNNRSLKNIIKHSTGLHTSIGVIDRTLFKKNALRWNPKLHKFQDRDFYHKLFLIINHFSLVDKPLFKWVKHKEERILASEKYSRKLYWYSLTSLLSFNFKHWRHIRFNKMGVIMELYIHLFRGLLQFGRIIPKSLKIWK